ncbi:hypothetical protein SHI21_03340 [Bacteriovorax sp. PP10]|uniref:Uncharacterized protein n=1 Tax=Bacteriovorax antarcticus TaxID=3088717 RepID=A0ABU5VU98_9BACT|nr:hypothetical protein [Bacteriovorax sp. PP10]MEA9355215.1 hypothetical protein [Bacteriovorax sp. PP10]
MKTLNLALIISLLTIHPGVAWSITTTTNETDTNAKLLENARASREAVNAKDPGASTQQIHAVGTGQATPTTGANLTDQEVQLKDNYIHQGLANQIITQNCSGKDAAICNGEAASHKFLGVDTNMVKAVAQAYALFGAIAGDSMGKISSKAEVAKKTAADAKTASAEANANSTANDNTSTTENSNTASTDKKSETSAEEDKVTDYCKYIPTVTEGVATAVQMAKSKELSGDEIGNGDTAQRDSLLKAAKSHDSRAKMAQIQAAGWFGGAACYAVNAALPNGWAIDKNLVIKMGAATLLGAFYQSEVGANKEYADKTRKIANSLPGKGDCNPVTDNLCYCSQPTTENDPTYCAKGLSKKAIAATSYRIACTDDHLKIDATCACEKTNTCFDTYLQTQGEGNLDLGGLGYSNAPFTAVRALARGELLGSTINTTSTDATSAIAKKGLRDVSTKLDNNGNLTKDQKAMADSMVAKGIPANVASLMAQGQVSPSAFNSAMGKISGATNGVTLASAAPGRGSNIVDFSGGNGLGYKGAVKAAGSNGAEEILAKLKPGQKAPANSKILEFAQKAEGQARQNGQIRKENDTPLFEIISLRYQTSGRRLLEIDSSN